MRTTVVNKQRNDYDVYIGRPSKWGNPFVIGKDGTRSQVIAKYKQYIIHKPELMAALPELQGKRLGCYCTPLACHGDVLAALADGAEYCEYCGSFEPMQQGEAGEWPSCPSCGGV